MSLKIELNADLLHENYDLSNLSNEVLITYTVDICRYETIESLWKCFVPFVLKFLPSTFKGITYKCPR
jgi:hypothetical protein